MFSLPMLTEQFLLKNYLQLRQLFFLVQAFPMYWTHVIFHHYVNEGFISRKGLKPILRLLKNQWFFRLRSVSELTTVDFPSRDYRFRLVYVFLSYSYTSRLLVGLYASEQFPVPSATEEFPGTCWLEREVWDMFGLFFQNNPDLRRLLTDYGFRGHPLRKDFPLSGFYEIFYDDRKKQIMYAKVSLAQELRNYRMLNPWGRLDATA